MVTRTVESIGIWSLAKILGIMGLLWGLIMTVISLFVRVMGGGMMGGGVGVGIMGGPEFLVWLGGGLLYGVVVGTITAIVYNAAASLLGGVELNLA